MGRKRSTPTTPTLICDRCGHLNPPTATECPECGSERFAPEWVLHQRRVNRQFAVQVTKPHELAESTNPRLTLSKWWPGGRSTFHFPTVEQWERVKEIVDHDLAQFLGWKTRQAVRTAITKRQDETRDLSGDLQKAAQSNPALMAEIFRGLKLDKITRDDVPQISRVLTEITEVVVNADDSMRRAIGRIVKQLPEQGEEAVEALSDLMDHLTLAQITAVTNEVKRRINLLEVFSARINDDRTYEVRGDGSIHRLLENAMWIVDERYWLMHSDAQLRKVVGSELAKEHEQFKLNRPDFVCGTVARRLIIIEIKRPSHVLTVADLNQLERYIVICREYMDDNRAPFEALLVGKKAADDLRKTLDVRGGQRFQVRTYTQLISDTEKRYKSYLEALERPAQHAA